MYSFRTVVGACVASHIITSLIADGEPAKARFSAHAIHVGIGYMLRVLKQSL